MIALTYANGDVNSPIVLAQYKQIEDTIAFEKHAGETLSMKQLVKTPSSRKRVLLAVSCAVFSTIAGNIAASYYLGPMLDNAGITDATTQLEIVGMSLFQKMPKLIKAECDPQCVLPRLLHRWHMACEYVGSQANGLALDCLAHCVHLHDWRSY